MLEFLALLLTPLYLFTIFGVVTLVAIIFIMFPQARLLFKNVGKMFIKDVASSPKLARATLEANIEKAQDNLNKIIAESARIAGSLSKNQKLLEQAETEAKREDKKITNAANDEDALLFADNKLKYDAEAEGYRRTVANLQGAYNEMQKTVKLAERQLEGAKVDRDIILRKMESNASMEEVYSLLNNMKGVDDLGKLTEHIKSEVDKTDERIEGLKVNYQNSTAYQTNEANERARKSAALAYLNEKRNQK